MPQVEAPFDPSELRRCIRDLPALSTLPAILKTFVPYRIADSVAAALTSMLDSDFVYILVPGKRDDPAIEIARSGKRIAADSLTAIRTALRDISLPPSPERVLAVPNPIGEGVLRIVSAPIGLGDNAIIVVGSRRSDFPTAAQRLLLGIAANEATIALQRWHAEADARVRQTEQELRLVIDTIPAIVWRKLPDGSADFINQRFREYWGLSAGVGRGLRGRCTVRQGSTPAARRRRISPGPAARRAAARRGRKHRQVVWDNDRYRGSQAGRNRPAAKRGLFGRSPEAEPHGQFRLE